MNVPHGLMLRACVLLGVIGFAAFLAVERGYLQLTLSSDRSYLSMVILLVYLLASAHWMYLVWRISHERRVLTDLDGAGLAGLRATRDGVCIGEQRFDAGDVVRVFRGLVNSPEDTHRRTLLVTAFGDRIVNRHALGHFVADTLLKLGLLGTIIGFILMLLPVGDMDSFDPSQVQGMLAQMSQGMAVALYTTLAGLVTSTLLRFQYHLLDGSAAALVTRVAEIAETELREADRAP